MGSVTDACNGIRVLIDEMGNRGIHQCASVYDGRVVSSCLCHLHCECKCTHCADRGGERLHHVYHWTLSTTCARLRLLVNYDIEIRHENLLYFFWMSAAEDPYASPPCNLYIRAADKHYTDIDIYLKTKEIYKIIRYYYLYYDDIMMVSFYNVDLVEICRVQHSYHKNVRSGSWKTSCMRLRPLNRSKQLTWLRCEWMINLLSHSVV